MKKKAVIISILVILVLCVGFIFSNSMKNGAESTSQSGAVKKIVDNALEFLNINVDISEQGIRTLGHVVEFFALSLVLTVAALILFPFNFENPFTKKLIIYFLPIIISTLVAFIDEFIQLFSPGRACDIMDVLVDFSGAALANLITMGIVFIIYAVKHKKSKD